MFLPGESQGRGSLLGCRLWGRTESDTTETTQQQQQQQQQQQRRQQQSAERLNHKQCFFSITGHQDNLQFLLLEVVLFRADFRNGFYSIHV